MSLRQLAGCVFMLCLEGANTPHRWPKKARRWCGEVVGGYDLPIAARACLASPHRPSVQRVSGVQDLKSKKPANISVAGLET